MAEDGFDEEYDPDFLDQLDQLEAQILSTQLPHPSIQPAPQPPPPPKLSRLTVPSTHFAICYSPPRELSQRVKDDRIVLDQSSNGFGSIRSAVAPAPQFGVPRDAKEREIDRLKRELGSMSKQLSQLEQECLELRKERDKRSEQSKSTPLCNRTIDAEISCAKNGNLDFEGYIQNSRTSLRWQNWNLSNDSDLVQMYPGKSACKDAGVQTEKNDELSNSVVNGNDSSTTASQHTSKLFDIWNTTSNQKSGFDLVSKLLASCETDFALLFQFLNSTLPCHIVLGSIPNTPSSGVVSEDRMHPTYTPEAAKVFHFYSMLTKTSNGMVKLESLLEALLDLCHLQNVVIVYRSLRILHVFLIHLSSMKRKTERSVLYSGTMSWLRNLLV